MAGGGWLSPGFAEELEQGDLSGCPLWADVCEEAGRQEECAFWKAVSEKGVEPITRGSAYLASGIGHDWRRGDWNWDRDPGRGWVPTWLYELLTAEEEENQEDDYMEFSSKVRAYQALFGAWVEWERRKSRLTQASG